MSNSVESFPSVYYRLDNRVVTPSTIRGTKDMWDADRRLVARTQLDNGLEVSTVFLVVNHSFSKDNTILFETMVFDTKDKEGRFADIHCERYSTFEEAFEGHMKVVRKVYDGEITRPPVS